VLTEPDLVEGATPDRAREFQNAMESEFQIRPEEEGCVSD